jgi:DNA gyrase subunit B
VVNRYAREKKLLKEKDSALTGDDVREGLAAIVSVKLREPQFEGCPTAAPPIPPTGS